VPRDPGHRQRVCALAEKGRDAADQSGKATMDLPDDAVGFEQAWSLPHQSDVTHPVRCPRGVTGDPGAKRAADAVS
jgi:hypothetical protein